MSPSKLDFLNRAHLQKKVELSNESGRLDVAQRLKVLLLEQFPESDRLDLNYIARTVAALKVRTLIPPVCASIDRRHRSECILSTTLSSSERTSSPPPTSRAKPPKRSSRQSLSPSIVRSILSISFSADMVVQARHWNVLSPSSNNYPRVLSRKAPPKSSRTLSTPSQGRVYCRLQSTS